MPKVSKQTVPKTTSPTRTSRLESVLERIAPIGFGDDDGLKVLLYGRSGTGKTTLWATFPKPILALVCSGGSKPGELRSIDTPEYRKTIRQVVLEGSREIISVTDALADDSLRCGTLVLDHASGLQDQVLKEILGLEELPAQKGWGMASQQQYGQCSLQCKELLRALLGLSCNVVIVAQEREFNTEADSELIMPFVGAGMTPSVTGWLNTAVDYIAQTFLRQREVTKEAKIGGKVVPTKVKTKEVEYVLRVGPDPVYTTKFRLPRGTPLPDVVVDPTYDKLIALIRGRRNDG
jgi:hypothetical protein